MMKKFLIESGKKIVTYISVFALLATAAMAGFTGIDFGVAATGGVWAGSGTADDPYEIADEADLREVVKCGGVDSNGNKLYFELVNDIALNDTTNWASVSYNSSYTQWEFGSGDNLTTTDSPVFRGDLQGNGHTISGLFYTKSGVSALFPLATGGATVSNLKLDKLYVNCSGYAGAIFGRVISGSNADVTVSYVSVSDAYIKSYYGVGGAGIVGAAHHGGAVNIKGCSFVKGTTGGIVATNPGAMIGDAWSCSVIISNCWSSGFPLVKKAFAKCSISNCYTDVDPGITLNGNLGVVSNMKGATAAICPNLDSSVIWEFVSGDYPKLRNILETINGIEGNIWSGATASKFASGSGTKIDPYIIKTGEQLYKMIMDKEKGAYYELGADIYLNDVSAADWQNSALPWATSGTYTDIDNAWSLHLEGNGHKISGLCIKVSGRSTTSALIPVSGSNTSITNVHIVDSYVIGQKDAKENYATAFIGSVASDAFNIIIGGCTVDDTVRFGGGNKVSGFIGAMPVAAGALIYNCGFAGQLNLEDCTDNFGAGYLSDSWSTTGGLKVYNSYCYGVPAVTKANGKSTSTKLYGTMTQENTKATSFPVVVLEEEQMKGDAAKSNMAFDWEAWTVVPNDLPFPTFDINGLDGIPGKVWSGLKADNYHPYTADYAYPSGLVLEDPSNPLSKVVDPNTGKYYYGDGSNEYPYHIATGEQLYKCVSENCNNKGVGVNYELIADIYLNDIESKAWEEKNGLNQWFKGNQWNAFRGHFNGNGHIVVGLAYDVVSDNSTLALFPCLGESGIIENVGVVNAYINDNSYTTGFTQYAASIVGYIYGYTSEGSTTSRPTREELEALGYTLPVIRKCFADADTMIRGMYAGGIVSGGPVPFIVEDCYFLGTVRGQLTGGIAANFWAQNCVNAYRCYCVTTDNDRFASGNWGRSGVKQACYAFERSRTGGGVQYVYALLMRGNLAKQNMSGLFENNDNWMVVEGGSPVLKVFGDRATQFSDKKYRPTVITFTTNTEECELESIQGTYGDPVTLPTPTRKGYDFGGWYYYKELQCEAIFTTLPMIGVNLYAKWIKNTITQDFENYPDTKYDRDPNGDYDYYRPGAVGYSASFVNGGSKSMHRKGGTTTTEDLLLNYEDTLVKNTIYEVTFWVMTDEEDTKATLSLVRNTWPDIDIENEPITGVEEMAKIDGDLVPGKWTQYTYKFTADTEWVSLRTTGDASLYFDDFNFVPVGTVEVKNEQAGGGNVPTSKPVESTPAGSLSPATADNTVSLVALMSAFAAAAVVLLFSEKHLTEVIDQ